MAVVSRTIDTLISLESKLQEAADFESAVPLYLAKKRLEEELLAMEVELKRLTHGWVWMAPAVAPTCRRSPVTDFGIVPTA
jgi:hypothetical protein